VYRVLRRHLTPKAFTVRPCSFSATPAAETLSFSLCCGTTLPQHTAFLSHSSLAMHLVKSPHTQQLALAMSANRAADGLYPAAKTDNLALLSPFAAV
jgi:hypothetical protein